MPTPEETRRFKRINVTIPVNFRIHPSMEKNLALVQREVPAHIVDISDTGMGIISSIYIPEGTLLAIYADISSVYPERTGEVNYLNLSGEVVSSRVEGGKYRLGILFKELKDQDKTVIKKILDASG